MKKDNIDLLNGNILLAITKLTLPIMGADLLTMAYNLTDMFWIGKLGSNSVASIGTAGMFLWFSEGILQFARVGGQVFTGQKIGAGQKKNAQHYAVSSLQLCFLIGLGLALAYYFFAPYMIGFFDLNHPQTIADAISYLKIVSFSVPVSYLIRMLTSISTAVGDSRLPLFVTSCGLVVNMVLDPLFIFTFQLGVNGAAYATVLAQIAVLIIIFFTVLKKDIFTNLPWISYFSPARYLKILKIGAPTAVQTLSFSAISMFIARLVANFGDAAVAVQKVGAQIESISWMTADGFGLALSAFIAQNFGAKKLDRARTAYNKSIFLVSIIGIAATALLFFLPGPIMSIFFAEADVLALGRDYLIYISPSEWFMMLEIVTAMAFAGYGKTTLPSVLNISISILRIPLSLYLGSLIGLNGIWIAMTLTSVLKGIILVIAYSFFIRQQKIDFCLRK